MNKKKLKLMKQLCGSCNCLTKTNDPEYHDELCYYRLLKEKEVRPDIEKFLFDFMNKFDENGLAAPYKIKMLRAYSVLEELTRKI